jgi:S-DNA-T family DNA segregation ATPase FtsK/SpoIIIE
MKTVDSGTRKAEGGVWRWLMRHRRPLAPVYLALVVWLIGVVVHRRAAEVGTDVVVGWLLIPALVLFLACRGFLDSGMTRVVVNLVGLTEMGWIAYAHAVGPTEVGALYSWLIISVVIAGFWWSNRVVEDRIKMERVVDSWPEIARAVNITRSAMPRALFRATVNGGWTARVIGPPSNRIIDRVGDIEAEMGLVRGKLTAHATTLANTTELRYEGPPIKPSTTVLRDPTVDSIGDEFLIGHRPNGRPTLFRLFLHGFGALHVLVAGTNGSGKSNFVNLLIAHVIKAPDAVAWFIDLKGGAESGPWNRALGYHAVNKAQATEMVNELKRIVDKRGGLLHKLRFGKTWKPSRSHPVICVFLDEVAELLGDRDLMAVLDELKSVVRRGRAVGVLLVMATQLPTNEAIGSTQIKAQFQYRISFRMNKRGQAMYILNNYEEVDVSALPGPEDPGWCLLERMSDNPFKTGTLYVPDDEIKEMAHHYGGPYQPEIDGDTREGMTDRYGDRDRDPLREYGDQGSPRYLAVFGEEWDGTYDGEEDDGEDDGEDGEATGDTSPDGGDDGGDAEYYRTLVVPAERGTTGTTEEEGEDMDEQTRGRPAGYGDEPPDPDLYNEEFPEMPGSEVPLSALPQFEQPKVLRLDDEAAENAFFAAADKATQAGGTISPAELAAASTWSRATVHRRLDDYMERALLVRKGTGQYQSTGGYRPHPEAPAPT